MSRSENMKIPEIYEKNNNIETKDLITSRLHLKEIDEVNAEFTVRLRSDPDIYRFFLNPHAITMTEHLAWLNHNYRQDQNRLDWVAFLSEDVPIGIFGLKRDAVDSVTAEISYILDKGFQGKGFAGEAVDALAKYAGDVWKCKCLLARIHKENSASIGFARANGFLYVNSDGIFDSYQKVIPLGEKS